VLPALQDRKAFKVSQVLLDLQAHKESRVSQDSRALPVLSDHRE
jgi:hypothetical protein